VSGAPVRVPLGMESGDRNGTAAPIADLHCHYPMHLLARDPSVQADLPRRRRGKTKNLGFEYLIRIRRQPGFWPKLRAALVLALAKILNFRTERDTWRVDLDKLRAGGVRVVLSVLYLPAAEINDPDGDGDYPELLGRLEEVEAELAKEPGDIRPIAVRSRADLDSAVKRRRIAIVHCVEGGFHLGRDDSRIPERVAELKRRGVAYITLAHLLFRGVATNAPALPMFSDRWYDRIFCQPDDGLTERGEVIVRAMYAERMLIDVSHMREQALNETFDLLRHLDRESGAEPAEHPVLATHAGFRFGDQAYMLEADTVREIARRDGVVGLIMAQHQLNEGLGVGEEADEFERSVRTICTHIDAIREHAGSNEHVGIGSDLDGFIKPTLAGIENVDDLGRLGEPLARAYPGDVKKILSGNALRVLRAALPS
jgi:microsomal dipeptidase-like Zn-dependent dipeptidase